MKRRLFAVLLAAGLAVSAVPAAAAETELISEAVAGAEEVVSEAAAQAEEIVSEAAAEAQEAQSEAADAAGDIVPEADEAPAAADLSSYVRQNMERILTQMSGMTAKQIEEYICTTTDNSTAGALMNWQTVRQDLKEFESLDAPEITVEGDTVKAVAAADYSGVNDKTKVTVTFTQDAAAQSWTMKWDVDYPMSTLIGQAFLNTIMGIGIVFLALLFLSWLIGKIHYIPDLIEQQTKKKAPAPAAVPAPAVASASAVTMEEEDLASDEELVAVIAAAIAAAEQTATDSFVVRSIRKANKKNWQKA